MGENSRRIYAAFASIAIATASLISLAVPSTAAPITTVTIPSPTPTVTTETTDTPALAPTPTTASAPLVEATAPSQAQAPATSAAVPVPSHTTATTPQTEAIAGGSTSTGQVLLSQLPLTRNVAPAYDRSYFTHWIDADGDGCDTRAEVLIEESLVPVTFSSGCTVATGQWTSPYDGATWTSASDVDIDHMVPLAEAWRSVAWSWTDEQRTAFANDTGYAHSLEAVTDNVNQSKSDQDPATWMPALNQCQYAIEWVTTKWRWNIGVDDVERSVLGTYLNGTSCGTTTVSLPAKMIAGEPTNQLWPLYKIVYDSTIYEMVTNLDGSKTPVALTYEKWRDVYNYRQPTPASTDFVKYPWSPTVYAVTFWPGGESAWMWTRLSFQQWQTAGKPFPRIAGWIKGSYYYQWRTSGEIFVEGEDGVNHKLTGAEWAASGYRDFERRSAEGFLKLTWAPEVARMWDVVNGGGRPLGFAEWQEEGFPTPSSVQRIRGDQFYQDYGNPTVYYAGPGMNRAVTFAEWQAAGSPIPTVRNAPPPSGGGTTPPPPGPTTPSNPGNSVNCTDFSTWSAAQNWFNTYYPYYGDVAGLDSDGDLIACETLPGHP